MKKTAALILLLFAWGFSGKGENIDIQAKAAILMEYETGRVLYEKNADERLAIASTTKIMTCLLALENASLDEWVTAGKNACGVPGTSIYLSEGEKLTMRDMLYGLMLRSGNDCAVAIAEHISGSEEAFSNLMNARAAALGADAYFTTANGLDKGGNGASARGIALIAREAMKQEAFREIVATKEKTIPWKDHQYERVLTNKNKLLTTFEGTLGIKTGYTSKAGRCLVFSAERNGMTLVGAVLGCPEWFSQAQILLEYGFSEYEITKIHEAGTRVLTTTIGGVSVGVCAEEAISVPAAKGERPSVKYELFSKDVPVQKGEAAGEALICIGEKCIYRVKLIFDEEVLKPSYPKAFERVMTVWPLRS